SRRALKEYKSARKKYIARQVELSELVHADHSASIAYTAKSVSKLSPVERVREAIRKGARTQREIAQETRLSKDEIGEAIANLLLWKREIKTQVVDNMRVYFINESPEALLFRDETSDLPARK